jgi:hypothetical protein
MALTNFKLLICLLILSESTLAQAECLRRLIPLRPGRQNVVGAGSGV